MRILLNAANLSTGGGLHIGSTIIQSWLQRSSTLLILASPELTHLLRDARLPDQHWIAVPERPGRSLLARQAFRKLADQTVRQFQPDSVFTVFGPPLWRPPVPHLCGFANGLYLPEQPVSPYGTKNTWLQRRRHQIRRKLLFSSLQHDTDALWVETENARQQLQALLPAKPIFVVPNEVPEAFEATVFHVKETVSTPLRVLLPAAGYSHKNFALLRVLLTLPEAHEMQFLVTLPPADFDRLFPDDPKPRNLGFLSAAELPHAYRQADVIFAPSLAEIYSATWLEAMAARRPLVCADIPEARDLCGNAALYFDGSDPRQALSVLKSLKSNPVLRVTQVRNGQSRLQALTPTYSRSDVLYQLLAQTLQPTA
jgi:glycosyltransferase involved in cell wall biosynthesis